MPVLDSTVYRMREFICLLVRSEYLITGVNNVTLCIPQHKISSLLNLSGHSHTNTFLVLLGLP